MPSNYEKQFSICMDKYLSFISVAAVSLVVCILSLLPGYLLRHAVASSLFDDRPDLFSNASSFPWYTSLLGTIRVSHGMRFLIENGHMKGIIECPNRSLKDIVDGCGVGDCYYYFSPTLEHWWQHWRDYVVLLMFVIVILMGATLFFIPVHICTLYHLWRKSR